jgi:type II secretory pathway pseudopilin PulG
MPPITPRRDREPVRRRRRWPRRLVGCAAALVAIAALVAVIFGPRILEALQKARQKRTLAELQDVGEALEAYRAEHDGRLPETDSFGELASLLVPAYLSELPTADAWDHPLVYTCWTEALPADPGNVGCDSYRLVSPGSDGALELDDAAAYEAGPFPEAEHHRDLVVGDGYVYRYPSTDADTATPP